MIPALTVLTLLVYRMQLKLKLEVKSLKGPIYVWMPPPPGDRLWFSFVDPPQLVATATPLVRIQLSRKL